MESWIIDILKRQKQAEQQEKQIQPQLPAPQPVWQDELPNKIKDKDSTIVDFEIKFWDCEGLSIIILE